MAVKNKLAIAICSFFLLPVIHADDQDSILYRPLPKWELGAFSGYFYLPDYPAAEESQSRFLILPYLIYRGDILRADRDGGIRGRFFNSELLEFDLSLAAGFKTHSADNAARAGMPDLDWMGEIGPRALLHLHKGRMIKIDLSLPLRYVFTTNFHKVEAQGYLFHPEFKFRHRALFDNKLYFSFGGGPVWGSESLNDYFFEVSPQYVASNRGAYDAQAGYMGLRTYLAVVRKISDDISMYMAGSKDYYKNAKNSESPLLRDIETESYFLGLSWGLYSSGVGAIDSSGE